MATTEGLNLLCHALAQQEAKCSITPILCHPQRDRKGKKQNLATGGAKPSAPFPLSTSSALLPYFTMCPLRVILGRDLVTFECPIKRRPSVRAPRLSSVQARRWWAGCCRYCEPCTLTHSSHPLILFHAYFPRLFSLVFRTNTLPSMVKDPLPVW